MYSSTLSLTLALERGGWSVALSIFYALLQLQTASG